MGLERGGLLTNRSPSLPFVRIVNDYWAQYQAFLTVPSQSLSPQCSCSLLPRVLSRDSRSAHASPASRSAWKQKKHCYACLECTGISRVPTLFWTSVLSDITRFQIIPNIGNHNLHPGCSCSRNRCLQLRT